MISILESVNTRGLSAFIQGRTLVYLKHLGSSWIILLGVLVITEAYCPPPDIPHGTVTAPRGNSLGAWVKVRCHEGYTWVGPARSICTERGIWDPPMSKCYDKCKRPTIEKSDEVTGPEILEHNNVIQVICKEGFTIANQGIIRCWNGSFIWGRGWAKVDEKIECKAYCPAPFVANSLVTTTDGQQVSSLATIRCHQGFTCRGSHKCRALCGADGKWFPELPQCQSKCRHPRFVNALVEPGTVKYYDGDAYSITCQFGYEIPHDGNLICDNGNWRFSEGSHDERVECTPVRCGRFEMVSIHALAVQGPEFPVHGNTARIICMEGHSIRHQGVVRCDNGGWVWHNTSVLDIIKCTKDTENHIGHQITIGAPQYAGQHASTGSSHWHIHHFLIPSLILSHSRYGT